MDRHPVYLKANPQKDDCEHMKAYEITDPEDIKKAPVGSGFNGAIHFVKRWNGEVGLYIEESRTGLTLPKDKIIELYNILNAELDVD